MGDSPGGGGGSQSSAPSPPFANPQDHISHLTQQAGRAAGRAARGALHKAHMTTRQGTAAPSKGINNTGLFPQTLANSLTWQVKTQAPNSHWAQG